MRNIKDQVASGIQGSEPKTKILQFGEGNFLRGFVDEMVDTAVQKGFMNTEVIIVKPRTGAVNPAFYEQDCYYTTSLRGREGVEEKIIQCVSSIYSCYDDYDAFMNIAKDRSLRFIVSNTTEAGIVFDETDRLDYAPPTSFPGKLVKFLYYRYKAFKGDNSAGVIILSVELIDDNGLVLKECMKRLSEIWGLGEDFDAWLDSACIFCSTLVDRIISGYPSEEAKYLWQEWGYKDELIVTGEKFGLWVIESDKDISEEFPLDKAGLPCIYTGDIKPYKKRKVRILNGSHTAFSLAAYLMGYDTVIEAMSDKAIKSFVRGLLEKEVIPTIDMDRESLERFEESVLDRFANPYIRHELSAIALNSVSKWKTRCLSTMMDYVYNFGRLPEHLVFSLAALLIYYRGEKNDDGIYIGKRVVNEKTVTYEIRDESKVIHIFENASAEELDQYVHMILSSELLWGFSLLTIEGLAKSVINMVRMLEKNPREAILSVIEGDISREGSKLEEE